MKKTKSLKQAGKGVAGWQCLRTAMLLCGLVLTQPVVHAQDPARNEATLNFVDADIESVIKAIGHYTNTTFLIDPRVKGTVTIVSEKPLTKSQAFNLLTSTLRMYGYTVVKSDGFTKVVPESDAKLQATPLKEQRIRGDQIATQIFRLRHESAAGLVPVLRPLISQNNTINAYPGSNALIITDYADNLQRLGRIIAALDRPFANEIEIIPVEHTPASDLAGIVNRLLGDVQPVPSRGNAASPTGEAPPLVLVDPRTNSIIIRAATEAQIRAARSLIQRLDQPTTQPGNVHVIHLRNAEATQLAQTLRAIVASEAAGAGSPSTPTSRPASQSASGNASGGATSPGLQTSPTTSPSPQQSALPTGGPGGFIQADPTTNTLIITAPEPVYRNLRGVIDQLDSRRAQVYVESLIVEVTASKAAEFGVQWAALSGNDGSRYRLGTLTAFSQGGNNLINQAVSLATANTPLPPGNGLNLGLFRQVNGNLTLGALARALFTDDDANILSMPNLITLDNEEARIIVGQNVPFITGQFTTPASGGGAAGVNPFQTIERRDIGLSLRVRPQISQGGTVKMAIYQETSDIQDTTTSGLITSKRSIETNVLVDDGQIIVLGGLINDSLREGTEKVPVLGDIPILGNLFKYQRQSRVKTNLMVFLRPTVIRNAVQSMDVTADRYDYIRNTGIASQARTRDLLPDMEPLLLPPLVNGQIAEPPLLRLDRTMIGATPDEVFVVPPVEGPLSDWPEPVPPPVVEPPASRSVP